MEFVEPSSVCPPEEFLRERLREVDLRSKTAVAPDHGAGNVRDSLGLNVVVELAVRKGRVDVLIHQVENHGDPVLMTGFHQSLEPVGSPGLGAWSEVVNRAVAPVEVKLGAGHRHQLQAVDPQALEIRDSVNDSVKRIVELADVQLVDDQVIQLWCSPRVVRPRERGARRRAALDGGEQADVRLVCKWICRPQCDRAGGGRRVPQLVPIEIEPIRTVMTLRVSLQRRGDRPEIERGPFLPRQVDINGAHQRVKAIQLVNDPDHQSESIAGLDSG